MMKLFNVDRTNALATAATLSDLKAALAEHGLVAVPAEPTEEIYAVIHENDVYRSSSPSEFYESLIKAAQA